MRLIVFCVFLSFPIGSAAAINVVTTIETLSDFTKQVGGDKVTVTSLSRGFSDPHFVEPKPSLVLILSKADLLIHVGLDLEAGWLPSLLLGARNAKIQTGADGNLDTSTLVSVLKSPTQKVDRSMGDVHPLGNPHFWIPPTYGLKIAKGILERLKKLDPTASTYFDTRFREFEKRISKWQKDFSEKLNRLKGTKVVGYHDSWAYVSDWLNLKEIDYVENKPGIPPSPQHLVKLVNVMKENNVKIIMMEEFNNSEIAKTVAEKAGARLLTLPSNVGATPDVRTYEDLISKIVNLLHDAIK